MIQMTVQIRIEGTERIQGRIAKYLNAKHFSQLVSKAVDEGKKYSEQLCPVDTGYMREQITSKKIGEMHYTLICDCNYAVWNEFGWYGIPEIGTADDPKFYKGGFRPFLRSGALRVTKLLYKYIKFK
jgi:hypothetical protein